MLPASLVIGEEMLREPERVPQIFVNSNYGFQS